MIFGDGVGASEEMPWEMICEESKCSARKVLKMVLVGALRYFSQFQASLGWWFTMVHIFLYDSPCGESSLFRVSQRWTILQAFPPYFMGSPMVSGRFSHKTQVFTAWRNAARWRCICPRERRKSWCVTVFCKADILISVEIWGDLEDLSDLSQVVSRSSWMPPFWSPTAFLLVSLGDGRTKWMKMTGSRLVDKNKVDCPW